MRDARGWSVGEQRELTEASLARSSLSFFLSFFLCFFLCFFLSIFLSFFLSVFLFFFLSFFLSFPQLRSLTPPPQCSPSTHSCSPRLSLPFSTDTSTMYACLAQSLVNRQKLCISKHFHAINHFHFSWKIFGTGEARVCSALPHCFC